jgi:hypothetical protein
MLYFDTGGSLVEATTGFLNSAVLEDKLLNLVASG